MKIENSPTQLLVHLSYDAEQKVFIQTYYLDCPISSNVYLLRVLKILQYSLPLAES